MNDRIYLDYASTTPVDPRVYIAMEPYWSDDFFHPWSRHSDGLSVEEVIEDARESIGHALGIKGMVVDKKLVFTSSGTESNTLALRGLLEGLESEGLEGKRIIISSIEHPSVSDIKGFAEKKGMHVDVIPIDGEGIIDRDAFKEALSGDTVLVSVQMANSEIGTIQPLRELIKEVRKQEHRIYVHSDASQAFLWQQIDVEQLDIDLLTIDAHKMYGPKGVGALYVRDGVPLRPLFLGSEKSWRSGTPPTPLIVGFATAVDIAETERDKYCLVAVELRDFLIDGLKKRFPQAVINGSLEKRVPGNVSVSFPGVNHDFLQVRLDEKGISVATRSACLEEGGEGSRVIAGIPGRGDREALRITLGRETKQGELEYFLEVLEKLF